VNVLPSADQVGDVLIFDILGGRFRLITRVSYGMQRIYIKALLNHKEYGRFKPSRSLGAWRRGSKS
jgi:mRNA interferase HigB